jgi:hypothetical protein
MVYWGKYPKLFPSDSFLFRNSASYPQGEYSRLLYYRLMIKTIIAIRATDFEVWYLLQYFSTSALSDGIRKPSYYTGFYGTSVSLGIVGVCSLLVALGFNLLI